LIRDHEQADEPLLLLSTIHLILFG
jgi:hypothetical protein